MNRIFLGLWPDRRTVWRWHFFAGLFCLPFVALLSLTGSIYLFKPQIDNWIDWKYDHLSPVTTTSPTRDVEVALATAPGASFLAYELPRSPRSAARILITQPDGNAERVYVDRTTHTVMKTVLEESRFERVVFKLHGQLLLGNVGSVIMEMVASWTFVLVITGVWLWWPHHQRGPAGVLYPRIHLRGTARWRDLHAVTGVWISLFLTVFLISGLPWSFVWGHALQSAENAVGHLTSIQDWEIGAVPARDTIAGHPATPPLGSAKKQDMNMPGMDMPAMPPAAADRVDLTGLDAVVRTGSSLSLAPPVLITPPPDASGIWTIRSDTQNRPLRDSVKINAAGDVIARDDFSRKGIVDRVVGYGVAAHEGHLFGWANQILNLVVALGLLLMSCAATLLWLKRKPPGQLGAPLPLPSARIGSLGIGLVIIMAILLPELGGALLLLVVSSLIFRKTSHD